MNLVFLPGDHVEASPKNCSGFQAHFSFGVVAAGRPTRAHLEPGTWVGNFNSVLWSRPVVREAKHREQTGLHPSIQTQILTIQQVQMEKASLSAFGGGTGLWSAGVAKILTELQHQWFYSKLCSQIYLHAG